MSQCPPPPTQISGALAIEQLNELVYVFDRQFRLCYVNDTVCRVLGYSREELLAASAVVIGAADPTSQEAGIVPGWNIGERKHLEGKELAARAWEFHTLVDHLPDVVVRYDLQLRRTYVNATFHAVHGTTNEAVLGKLPGGHDAGDAALVATAQRLRSVVREADTVARFGGEMYAEKARRQSRAGRYG